MKMLLHNKGTLFILTLWVILFLLSPSGNFTMQLSGKGLNLIGTEYYRFLTGPLLHFNVLHLVFNAITLYWLGCFLEPQVGSVRFVVFAIAAATLAEAIYCTIFRYSEHVIGGSVCLFALMGLLMLLQILRPEVPRFMLGTWYGNWIVGYAILGNIPMFSFTDIGTVSLHIIALLTGVLLGIISVFCKLI